jgi:hypothetical protein
MINARVFDTGGALAQVDAIVTRVRLHAGTRSDCFLPAPDSMNFFERSRMLLAEKHGVPTNDGHPRLRRFSNIYTPRVILRIESTDG